MRGWEAQSVRFYTESEGESMIPKKIISFIQSEEFDNTVRTLKCGPRDCVYVRKSD